ncbi:MAG TPA: CHAD domain-containing protein [Pseudonocardiaceae bacterium]|nr:CHAD domain-containing protein [Pseudonocardiaceae bacterium]
MSAVPPAAQRSPHRTSSAPGRPAGLIELGDPVTARPSDPVGHQLRAALDTRVRALVAHDPGTRLGQDPEELHQMRVAVRRMRAALKAVLPLLDRSWADELRAELGWLGRALGPVRDADVLLQRLRGRAAAFDRTGQDAAETLLQALVAQREAARAKMLSALDSERYAALLDRLAAAVSAPLPAPAGNSSGPGLLELVRIEFRRVRKAVALIGEDPPDEVLHALRIKGKRLRYTAELAATSAGKPVRKLVESTVALQDVLGEHQDACVAQQRVIALLDGLGDVVDLDVVFVAGRLVEREEASRLATRDSWSAAWQRVRHRAEALGN